MGKSLTIIDKTKPEPAKFVAHPHPKIFKTKLKEQKYWSEERRRWIEGYGDGHSNICGFHYFYLMEGHLKIQTGDVIRPIWRDLDDDLLRGAEEAMHKKWDYGVIKRRECGLTSIGAGLLPNYFMRVYPGSTSLMTSCDKDRIFKMFFDKTEPFYKNMDRRLRPVKVARNLSKQGAVGLITKVRVQKKEFGEWKTIDKEGDIYCRETATNPKAFSQSRAMFGFFDEFPLHPERSALLGSSEPCFIMDGVRHGLRMWGGTVEFGLKPENLKAMQSLLLVMDPELTNNLIHFVPAWKGRSDASINGWSNEELGTEAVLKKRDKMLRYAEMVDTKEAWQAYREEVKNHPLTIDEVIESVGEGVWPREIQMGLEKVKKVLMDDPPPIEKCFLGYNSDGGLDILPDPKDGVMHIFERPKTYSIDQPYIAGNDPIPYGDREMDDGSDDCTLIKNRVTQQIVAIYKERNLDSELTTTRKIQLLEMYDAKMMVEMNRGEVVFKTFERRGRLDLLAEVPRSISEKYEKSKRGYGFNKDRHTEPILNAALIEYLKRYTHTIKFLRMVDELEMYLVENTDIVDALGAVELYDLHLRAVAQVTQKRRQKKVFPNYRNVNGRMQLVFEEVIVNADGTPDSMNPARTHLEFSK